MTRLSAASPPTADADMRAAVAVMMSRLPHRPRIGVILGSGLGAAGRRALQAGAIAIDYADIPNMPQPAVDGHAGQLIAGIGALAGTILLRGRVHYYEGHAWEELTFATRLLAELGIEILIVSNAAGGITAGFSPGDLMLINGHWTRLNVQQPRAARCRVAVDVRPKRSSEDCLWHPELRQIAAAVPTSLTIHEGVYAMNSGPNYETPAEIRMLRTLGVDAVGMSTVPEALAAAARGINVLGVSCITNLASGLTSQPLNHAEVGLTAAGIEDSFTEWLFDLLQALSLSRLSGRVTTDLCELK
ncbi:MAG: purine-nucleoside phosphorylase [Planctomycetaceae bacterium]